MIFVKLLVQTYLELKQNKIALLRTLLFPFSLSLIGNAILDNIEDFRAATAFTAVLLPVDGIIAITTHRIILLGPESVPNWGINKWTFRESYFLLYLLVLFLLSVFIGALAFAPLVISISGIAILLWGLSRVSLAFPGIAVDRDVGFFMSWRLTKENQILMALVTLGVPLVLGLAIVLLEKLPFFSVISPILSGFLIVLIVGLLSTTYRYLTDGK